VLNGSVRFRGAACATAGLTVSRLLTAGGAGVVFCPSLFGGRAAMRIPTMRLITLSLLAPLMCWLPATAGLADEDRVTPVQIVALDECDPPTFNAVIPDFCKNVTGTPALPFSTTFADLLAKAAAHTPDPGWDFEPDSVTIKKGTPLIVVNQGGEPHTFTEVANFGGGFVPPLNAGEAPVPECAGGFKDVAVARTRILQGSQLQVTGLSKGTHHFECCIHPWMRVTVEVK
jgi:plastocyanin